MNEIISYDLYRYGGLKGVNGFRKGFKIPGFRYTYFLRMARDNNKYSFKGIFSRMFIKIMRYKFGFQIELGAQIGKGFYIGHFGTIIIGGEVIIGSNCNVSHNVTIGGVPNGKLKGVPTIGDRVWIGTGAVVVGKINVGSDVLIAPNSLVNFNVPANSTVIGNPARIIKRDNPPTGYINNIL